MALPTTEVTSHQAAGRQPQAPLYADKLSFVGDDEYPTGGTPDFTAWVQARLGRLVTLVDAWGFGYASGTLSHIAQYDSENDTLRVATIDEGAEAANEADLSTVTFEVTILSH